MAAISISGLAKRFGASTVIPSLSLEIADGAFTVFVGPSGCGKSTLLRLIAGLEDSTEGTIRFGDRDVTTLSPSERQIAMVFQSYALFPHLTVGENIGFGLKLAKLPKAEIEAKVKGAAEALKLDHLLDRKPKALSGGQRQRVAIGRAIVRNPDCFLFDEPLSNLDAALRVEMRVELAELHRRLKATMIYVTHDQVEAMTLADQIVVLDKGRIQQAGPPMELYRRPANRFVATFIGSPTMNLVEGAATAEGIALADGSRFPLPAGVAASGPVELGVRPEHLAVTADGAWAGRVAGVERLGAETYLYVSTETLGRLTVRAAGDLATRVGDAVRLAPDPAHLHVFDANGRRC